MYFQWNVKMRRDGEKSFKVIKVYARNRNEARIGALRIHEKYKTIYFSLAACEASKIKKVM